MKKESTEKWRMVCVEFTNGVRGLLVVDSKDKVVAGGGFDRQEDANAKDYDSRKFV